MKYMRVLRGKVVGNTVVVEGQLPEGSAVEVVLREAEDTDFVLTEAMESDLALAMEEAQRGEGISAEAYFASLSPYEAPR